MAKPIIVGELNPFGSDPCYALYPAPDGCSGHRLCCLILGMQRAVYLDAFERANLCEGKWSVPKARAAAEIHWSMPGKFILLGAKVCAAWRTPFNPFEISDGGTTLVLPHPSGRCRLWQQTAIAKARAAVRLMCPELSDLIGA